jgi:hypothetical protein
MVALLCNCHTALLNSALDQVLLCLDEHRCMQGVDLIKLAAKSQSLLHQQELTNAAITCYVVQSAV